MTEKLQQLTDELRTALFMFENDIGKQLRSVKENYKSTIENLQTYLLTNGMPSTWHISRITDTGTITFHRSSDKHSVLETIVINQQGVIDAYITDFTTLKEKENITLAEYKQLNNDFCASITFFQHLDYNILNVKVREFSFHTLDKLTKQIQEIYSLRCELAHFRQVIKDTGK